MNMEKYLRAVHRRLNMPKELKERVMTDFISSIEARKEDGQSEESIRTELGSPKQAAKELNEQMKEYTYQKSPWRWLCLVLAVFSALSLAYGGLRGLLAATLNATESASIGIIGGADGPTAIFVTTTPDTLRYTYLMSTLLLAMGIAGFFALSRIRRK